MLPVNSNTVGLIIQLRNKWENFYSSIDYDNLTIIPQELKDNFTQILTPSFLWYTVFLHKIDNFFQPGCNVSDYVESINTHIISIKSIRDLPAGDNPYYNELITSVQNLAQRYHKIVEDLCRDSEFWQQKLNFVPQNTNHNSIPHTSINIILPEGQMELNEFFNNTTSSTAQTRLLNRFITALSSGEIRLTNDEIYNLFLDEGQPCADSIGRALFYGGYINQLFAENDSRFYEIFTSSRIYKIIDNAIIISYLSQLSEQIKTYLGDNIDSFKNKVIENLHVNYRDEALMLFEEPLEEKLKKLFNIENLEINFSWVKNFANKLIGFLTATDLLVFEDKILQVERQKIEENYNNFCRFVNSCVRSSIEGFNNEEESSKVDFYSSCWFLVCWLLFKPYIKLRYYQDEHN